MWIKVILSLALICLRPDVVHTPPRWLEAWLIVRLRLWINPVAPLVTYDHLFNHRLVRFGEHFVKRQWRSLCVALVHLKEQKVEVEFVCPLGVVRSVSPLVYEVVENPIVLVHIVKQLNHLVIRRFVQVDERGHAWILVWKNELKADIALFVRKLNRQLSAHLNAVVLSALAHTNAHNGNFHGHVSRQKCVQVWSKLV